MAVVVALVLAVFIAMGAAATPTTLALFTGNNQSGTVGQALANPLFVRVTDANYDPVPGVVVSFAVTAGGGSLSVSQALTDAQGQASTVLTLGFTPGRSTVAATATNLSGSPVTFTATGSLTVGTVLCGGLFDDTTWTKAQSPYIVTCPVTLFPGKTLTIEPGAVIRFTPGTGLTIRGTLNAVGRADERITLNSVTAPNLWNGVQLATNQGGKAVIAFADLSYASTAVSVECCRGALEPANISDSTFRNNSTALGGYADYKEIVTNSTFENNVVAIRSADKLIYDSVFRGNTFGLSETERISVYRSTFEGNEVALYGGRGLLQDCRIVGNGTGVRGFFEGLTVSRNSITGNVIGVLLSQYDSLTSPVEQNNIFGNTTYDVKVTGSANVSARNNWWGTTDTTAIDAKIFDGRDDPSLGLLVYVPFLSGPVSDAPGINPVPSLTSLSRASALSGSLGFTLVVTGNNFTTTSVVRWNGDYRPTVFVNSTTLQASIPARDLAAPGTAAVTVFSPLPGGGLSSALTLSITPGTPTLNSISPSTAVAGGLGFILTATGSGFVNGAVVRWNGDNRPTTFVNSTQLQASIPASDIASRGDALIAVAISASAPALPNAQRFTITSAGTGACSYSLTPPNRAYNSSGGTGGFEVFTSSDCTWPVTSNATWIVLTSISPGRGNGAVFYSFTANTSSISRTGTITVAAQTFTITQAGAPGSVTATAFEPRLVRNLAPGFYILEATLGPQALGGFWGMEVITSLGQAAGGFNLGGGVAPAAATPGFGGFLLSGTQTVTATLNAQVSPGTLMTLRFLDSGRRPIGDPVMGVPPLTLNRQLDAGFYIVEVYSSGPAPFNFQLGLAADFFVGGVNTGGYLGPGNVGFGAFYVPETQDVTMRLYGRSTYGATGAGDLVLTLRDANRTVLVTVSP